MDPEEREFGSAEASRLAQVTLRQLQWWDERGAISPRRENRRRVYRTQEVLELTIAAALRRKGMSFQKTRRILGALRRELRRVPEGIGAATLWLLTDGQSAHLEDRAERLLERIGEAKKPVCVVCLSDQVKRIAAETPPRRQALRQLELF
jgi:DNA-binding transcriptional MerR regulator